MIVKKRKKDKPATVDSLRRDLNKLKSIVKLFEQLEFDDQAYIANKLVDEVQRI